MTRNGIIVVNNAKTNTLLFHAVHTLWLKYAGWENQRLISYLINNAANNISGACKNTNLSSFLRFDKMVDDNDVDDDDDSE